MEDKKKEVQLKEEETENVSGGLMPNIKAEYRAYSIDDILNGEDEAAHNITISGGLGAQAKSK